MVNLTVQIMVQSGSVPKYSRKSRLMLKVSVTIGLMFISLTGFSQRVEFSEVLFDFGPIRELDGPAQHTFTFINKDTAPVAIAEVKPSCGCTSAGWSQDTIMPGDTGYVIASFNPANRPGSFEKSIQVVFNEPELVTELKFKGFVVSRQHSIREEFSYKSGNLSFINNPIHIGRVVHTIPVNTAISLYNHLNTPVRLIRVEGPDHIKAEVPKILEPNSVTEIHLHYLGNGNKKNEYGPVSDVITLVTDDTDNPKKQLKITAEITDMIMPDSLKGEQSRLPQLELSNTSVLYDTIQTGHMAMKEIEIRNTGKSDLLIRKILSDASYISVEIEKKQIKPGSRTRLKVVYNSSNIIGKDAKKVTIYSNDPDNPVKELPVRAIIVR